VLYHDLQGYAAGVGEELGKLREFGTLLVVDGDSDTRRLVAEQAEGLGLSCRAFATSEGALAELEDEEPSLAVVEVELEGLNGLGLLHALQDRFEGLPVILVTSTHVDAIARAAGLMLGADDYLVKPLDPTELRARMRRSLRRSGRSQERGRQNGRANETARSEMSSLSPREREILAMLAKGETQEQIAADLVLSSRTVATHIQNLLKKLGVHSRAQAVAAAYRAGLVGSPDPDSVEAHALDPGAAFG
jgi:DNA-binding NarL/FixJ family response regulator